jgi:hypothetical protein
MPPRSALRDYAAALAGAGFRPEVVAPGAGSPATEVYRRPAEGRWFLEARHGGDRAQHLDVGLTVDTGGGPFIGPVHRALTPAALASALPHIVASLEALATAAESLRCPRCTSWPAMKEGADGPFLACAHPRRPRRPFDPEVRRCRRDLVMAGLILHRDPKSPW